MLRTRCALIADLFNGMNHSAMRVTLNPPPRRLAEGALDAFTHHLRDLKLDAAIERASLAAGLATASDGCTGADIAFVCQRAALLCVKAAASTSDNSDISITGDHLRAAISIVTGAPAPADTKLGRRLHAAG